MLKPGFVPSLTDGGFAFNTLTITFLDNILHYMRTSSPLLAPLFRSEGQARLLSVAYLGGEELSLTELAERAEVAYPTAHREVRRLLQAGILSERTAGRTRLISADNGSPLYPALRDILLIATGPVVLLAEELAKIPGIESAFLYGSFAARMRGIVGTSPDDIDLMVIGSPEAESIYDACERVGQLVHRPVNPTILTTQELESDSGFLHQVSQSPLIPIVGEVPWPGRD
jgi:hypothetical protein